METKPVDALYFAGQINGTRFTRKRRPRIDGGHQCALKLERRSALILDRSQAYIGVLIDDLGIAQLMSRIACLPRVPNIACCCARQRGSTPFAHWPQGWLGER